MDSSSAVYYNKITRGVMVYAIYYELMVVGPLAMVVDEVVAAVERWCSALVKCWVWWASLLQIRGYI